MKKTKEEIKEHKRLYYIKNKEVIAAKKKAKYDKDSQPAIDRAKAYYKKKRETDNLFRFQTNVGTLVRTSIKKTGFKKLSRTEVILGCSLEFFKEYIEKQFKPFMSWDNYGLYNGTLDYGWDIDHIIPVSTATTEDDIIKLNHYTNLQPLCSYVNRHIKRNNII